MSEKSFVTLERRVCLVCGEQFDTGALLLDRRMRPSFEKYTCTGWDLCPEHRRLHEDGYIALVECDPQKSGLSPTSTTVKPGEAYRTGRLAHIKREVFSQLFSTPCPSTLPLVFVEPQVIDQLQARMPQSSATDSVQ